LVVRWFLHSVASLLCLMVVIPAEEGVVDGFKSLHWNPDLAVELKRVLSENLDVGASSVAVDEGSRSAILDEPFQGKLAAWLSIAIREAFRFDPHHIPAIRILNIATASQ